MSAKIRTGRKQFVPKPERGDIAGENEDSEMFGIESVRLPRSYFGVADWGHGRIDIDTGRTQMYVASRGDAKLRCPTSEPDTGIEISPAKIKTGEMPLQENKGSGDCSNMIANVGSNTTPLRGLCTNRNISSLGAASMACDPERMVLKDEPSLTVSRGYPRNICVPTAVLSESAVSRQSSGRNHPCLLRRSHPNIPIETHMEIDTTISSFRESSCENIPSRLQLSEVTSHDDALTEVDTGGEQLPDASCGNMPFRLQRSWSTSSNDTATGVNDDSTPLQDEYSANSSGGRQSSVSTLRSGAHTEASTGGMQSLESSVGDIPSRSRFSPERFDTHFDTGNVQLVELHHGNIPGRFQHCIPNTHTEPAMEVPTGSTRLHESQPSMEEYTESTRLHEASPSMETYTDSTRLRGSSPPMELYTESARLHESSPPMELYTESARLHGLLPPMELYAESTRLHELSPPLEVCTGSTRLNELVPPMKVHTGSTRLQNNQRPFERSLPNIHAATSSEKSAVFIQLQASLQESFHVDIPSRLRRSMPNIAAETPTDMDTESAQMQESFLGNDGFCLRRSLPITHLDTLEVNSGSAQLSDSFLRVVSCPPRCSLPNARNDTPNTGSSQLPNAFRINVKRRSPIICDETAPLEDARSVHVPISSSRGNIPHRSVLNLGMETDTRTDRRSTPIQGADFANVPGISPNDLYRITTDGMADMGAGDVLLPGGQYRGLPRQFSATRATTSPQTQLEIEKGNMPLQGPPSEDKSIGIQPNRKNEHQQMRKLEQWPSSTRSLRRASKIPVATKSWDGTVCAQLQRPGRRLAPGLLLRNVHLERSRESVGVETRNVQERWSDTDDASSCSSRSRQDMWDSEGSGSLQSLPCDLPHMRTDSPTFIGQYGSECQSPNNMINTHSEMEELQTAKQQLSKPDSEMSRSSSSGVPGYIESVRLIEYFSTQLFHNT